MARGGQRIEDAADLYFYNSRWYDPAVGRFLGPDTVVPEPGNPQSLNRYAYVNNNPLRYTDPSGAVPIDWLIDFASIVFDIQQLRDQPSWENVGWLALDVVFGVVPYVPAGFGPLAKGSSKADDVLDLARAAGHADEALQFGSHAHDALEETQQLVKIGLRSEQSADLVNAIAEASTRGDFGSEYVLLGSFQEYIDLAKLEGMTYFDMSEDVWRTLNSAGDEFVEAVNIRFLENAIASHKSFVVVLGEGKSPGKWLQKELQYLIERGYRLESGIWVPGE